MNRQIRNGCFLLMAVIVPQVGMSLIFPQLVQAQGSSVDSSLYLKAQQMVSNGDATAGRAVVDSLLKAAPVGSPQYAEALYWHATLAASANTAERDYRHIIVDYPLSSRVDDALLRIGQLELTRGDADAALQHFQRLVIEHPDSPLRAKTSYWTARALFEKNDISHACGANAEALARVQPADVELKNQIDYQNQRCRGVAVASSTPSPTPSSVVATAEPAVAPTTVTSPKSTVSKVTAKNIAKGNKTKGQKPAIASTAAHTAVSPASPTVPDASGTSDTTVRTAVRTAVGTSTAASAPNSPNAETHTQANEYAVQVAAYYDQTQADALAVKLRSRGYQAHVDGTVAPFRVRIGHFPSRAAATAMLAKLKARKITGFVTQG